MTIALVYLIGLKTAFLALIAKKYTLVNKDRIKRRFK